MIRPQIILFIILLLSSVKLRAQINPDDPFDGNYQLSSTAQLVLMKADSGGLFVNGDVYTTDGPVQVSGLQPGLHNVLNSNALAGSWAQFDMASGDFNENGLEEFAAAWEISDHSIQLMIAGINVNDYSWYEIQTENLMENGYQKLFESETYFIRRQIRVVTGQFDEDGADDLVLAYFAEDGSVQLLLYDFDGLLNPVVQASTNDSYMNVDPNNLSSDASRSCKFDIAAADFNGDGRDEIMLVYVERDGSKWVPYVKIYSYDILSGQLYSTLKDTLDLTVFNKGKLLYRLALSSGNFDIFPSQQAVLSWQLYDPGEGSAEMYLQTLRCTAALDSVHFIGNALNFDGGFGAAGNPLSLIAGDIDNDAIDEIYVAASDKLRIYKTKQDMSIGSSIASIDLSANQEEVFQRTIAFSDLDAAYDSSLTKEIVVADRAETGIRLRVYQDSDISDSTFSGLTLTEDLIDSGSVQIFALTALNKDGIPLLLGPPERHTRSEIAQALVILNAPPIHFDIFDSTAYDINNCYEGEPCLNRSVYINATTVQTEVSTEVSSDWGVSKSLSASGGFSYKGLIGAKVSSTLTRRYGEGFSKIDGSSETYQVTVTSDAIDDDRIFATIANYEILEYPVYTDGQIVGHVVAVVPQVQGIESLQNTWLGSKSGKLREYPVQHEVGNILSYKSLAQLPPGATLFGNGHFTSGGGNTWEMSPSASQTWELAFNSSEIIEREKRSFQQVSRTRSGGASGAFGPFNLSFSASLTDDYSKNQISTHKINVKQESALQVEFGPVDGSILGTKTYTVSPFVYWSEGGALVLDYAVQPDLSAGVASWWEENYSSDPDLALILPWRYDQQKGLGGPNPDLQKEETREIIFNPANPKPGELTEIWLRLHNFSFKDFLGNASIQFYLGDPANGGTLIVNEDGKSTVNVTQINSRQSVIVSLDKWLVPSNITDETKVYALIDPANEINEIHENNNKGWTLLNAEYLQTALRDEKDIIPADYVLKQNYPNPFNPETNIEYRIAKSENVKLTIYNLLGQKMVTLVNKKQAAGHYTIQWDATGFASGIYIYTLETGNGFKQSKKLVIIK